MMQNAYAQLVYKSILEQSDLPQLVEDNTARLMDAAEVPLIYDEHRAIMYEAEISYLYVS